MQVPLFLAHGALGWADEATVFVVGIAIVAYIVIVFIGDRKARPEDDKEPKNEPDSHPLD